MTSPPPSPNQDQTPLFRPSKKRKIYRQRAPSRSSSPPQFPAPLSLDDLINSAQDAEPSPASLAEILRLRKLRKSKGVEFRPAAGYVNTREEGAVVVRNGDGEEGEEMEGGMVTRKFAKQTGTVGDVNKHMMAYIDTELAKRRGNASTSVPVRGSNTREELSTKEKEKEKEKEKDVQRQPAAQGKLQEIDLGDEARDRNVARTDRARRKMGGEEVEDEGVMKTAKVRLGRDGKPWRGRKRRGSEDVKRDQMVEDILRENRLEIYEEPPSEPHHSNDDQAADDRIAEAFRRDFMDAVSQRQRKKTGPAAAPPVRGPGGKKEEEVLKGPKLGGSRSARAAMREMMLKEGKK